MAFDKKIGSASDNAVVNNAVANNNAASKPQLAPQVPKGTVVK
jgi:hypothetical protein